MKWEAVVVSESDVVIINVKVYKSDRIIHMPNWVFVYVGMASLKMGGVQEPFDTM